jgi:DNA-binding phage protein
MAKVLITLEDNLLRQVDRVVRERGLTRSAYLAALARRDIERELGPGADPDVRTMLGRLDALFARNPAPGDATEIVRQERDRR